MSHFCVLDARPSRRACCGLGVRTSQRFLPGGAIKIRDETALRTYERKNSSEWRVTRNTLGADWRALESLFPGVVYGLAFSRTQ